LAELLAKRIPALLRRRRLDTTQSDEQEPDRLARDQPWLSEVYAASVCGRIATGPEAPRVPVGGDRVDPESIETPAARRCAAVVRFSLHGNVAIAARDRPRLERLFDMRRARLFRLRNVWNDPHIDEIVADDLLGDYPSIMYGPPEESFAIDFLTKLGEAYTYDSLRSESIEYDGIPVRLVTAKQLYEMKRNTVRLKDKADCVALNEKFHFEDS
jgi:hypothetical protein